MKRSKQNKVFRKEEVKKKEIKTFLLLSDETVLPDDYPVNPLYVYICDNVFVRCLSTAGNVGIWKMTDNIKEIRRCNLFGHEGARLGDRCE